MFVPFSKYKGNISTEPSNVVNGNWGKSEIATNAYWLEIAAIY